MFLVASKHPKTSHRIFCPVQFSNEFFCTGHEILDFSFKNFFGITWFFGFFLLWLTNLSPILKWFRYPTYLTVESDAKHAIWVINGIKTKMHFKSLVVLFRQINFWWTLLFGKQRGCIPGLYYQRGRKAHALKPMCKNACTRIQITLVQGITWDW